MLSAAPIPQFNARALAAQADFSIDDYGKADDGPYQIVQPAYAAPQWLKTFAALGPALRECGTLCRLRGVPFRVVRWGREGSGAHGGIPCVACAKTTPNMASRFPKAKPCRTCRKPRRGLGYLPGFPDAHPIAEFRPNGQRLVFNNKGVAQLVGRPNYVISHNPFPRTYRKEIYPQRYLEAVRASHVLANTSGKRVFVVAADDAVKNDKGVPVAYVDPQYGLSGLGDAGSQVIIRPVSPEYFQELVAQSQGRSYLGQGA